MPKVTIYSKTVCSYCTAAKNLFTRLGVPFEEVNLDHAPELREQLEGKYNWRTVPMIVVGDRFLGGYDDVSEMHRNGALKPLLSEPIPPAPASG